MDARFKVKFLGSAGERYDRYPESWDQGCPAPNLESFAGSLLKKDSKDAIDGSDCLVFGSRGGQVVLPYLWRTQGEKVPPAVIINGGCAMDLPTRAEWPESAVTFLLLGGRDYFRGRFSKNDYVANVKTYVPNGNRTTAILFVNEMEHMPHAALLRAVLAPMLATLLAWKAAQSEAGGAPKAELQRVFAALEADKRWSGRLMFTTSAGAWEERQFGPSPKTTPPPQPRPHGLHGATSRPPASSTSITTGSPGVRPRPPVTLTSADASSRSPTPPQASDRRLRRLGHVESDRRSLLIMGGPTVSESDSEDAANSPAAPAGDRQLRKLGHIGRKPNRGALMNLIKVPQWDFLA
jgi:hypothetical protein